MGEEDVTMRQDITATSGASSSCASRGPAMDIESRPSRKRVADVQTEDLQDNDRWMQMKVQRHLHKRLQMEECLKSETHNQRLEDKAAGDGYLGLDECMDITTVNEQSVQWDFTNVEIRNQAFRKIVG